MNAIEDGYITSYGDGKYITPDGVTFISEEEYNKIALDVVNELERDGILTIDNGYHYNGKRRNRKVINEPPQTDILELIKIVLILFIFGYFFYLVFTGYFTDSKTYSGGSSSSSGGGSYTGTLQISADSGANVYVGSSYVGRGGGFVTLNPGSYTVSAYSSSTDELCWRTSTTVYSGKNSVVRNNAWCR